MKFFRDLSIKYKLLIGYIGAFMALLAIGGLIVYPVMRQTIEGNIESELNNSTTMILDMVKTATDVSIKNYLRAVAEKNRDIVEDSYKLYQQGILSEKEAKQRAISILLSQRIGDTGYIYCLDSKGIIEVHPVAALLGADLTRYDFIQEQLKNKEGYIEYDWKNPGETKERQKALYMSYFKPWDWIISASSYRQEFKQLIKVDTFRDSILALRFGKTGYPYILDSQGNVVIHPVLTGNMYEAKDSTGRQFVKEMLEKKNGKITYAWRNPGENEYREKLVIFNHIPELDWIVASSSYEEDFYEPLYRMRNILGAVFMVFLLFLFALTYFYSSYIVKSLNGLIQGFIKGSAGDFAVRLSGMAADEFGRLSGCFNDFMEKLDTYKQSSQQQIQERLAAENELREVNRTQTLILENSVMGIGFVRNRLFEWVNPRLPAMFGLPYDQVKGASSRIIYPSDEVFEEIGRQAYPVLGQGKGFEFEIARSRADGTLFTGRVIGKAVDPSRPQEGSIWLFEDITERKQAEETLRESETRMHEIINFIPDATFAIDTEGKVIAWNLAIQEMTGVRAEDMLGKGDFAYSLPFYGVRRPILIDLVFKSDEEVKEKYFFVKREGECLFAEADVPVKGQMRALWGVARALYNSKGNIVGAIESIRDITERKQAEQDLLAYRDHLEDLVGERTADLEKARDAAEAANRAKSVFLANMSHELRTPLNAILGFSRLLGHDLGLSLEQKESLTIIEKSGDHLLGLINDVLDIAKIEAGHIQANLAPIDFGSMIADLVGMLRVRAEEKGLQLLFDQSSDFPRFIMGDATKLRQILINLISNAIKATEQGGVTLRLGTREDQAESLVIEVEDTGLGIASADQEKIFETFVQLDSPGKTQGTGLGLAITRQFVKLLGGELSLNSTLGQGSTFRVELPFVPAKPDDIHHLIKTDSALLGLAPGQPTWRILVVEDQRENQILLTRLLARVGFEVRLAENGVEALRIFSDWQPHFIWMDRRMPLMDGVETTQRIRTLANGDTVKIAAVTASSLQEEDAELFDAGFDEIIHKPYRPEQIFDCMARLLSDLRFVYSEEPPLAAKAPELTAASFAVVSDDLRQELARALIDLNDESIDRLVDRISQMAPDLAVALRERTKRFDYDSILNLLEKLSSHGTN